MADISIEPADIRNRLRTLSEVTISDDLISSLPFIGISDSWANILLSSSGTSATDLSEDQGILLKGAKIAYVCKKIISSAPENEIQEGPVKIKPVSAKDKKDMIDILDAEITEYLDMCGLYKNDWADLVTSSGGDDYHPSGYDYTQTDYSYTDIEPFRNWP